ncbi:MAG: DUF4040 domain-containing protein [Oscillospiraceae bacterium]|nr:DUF4040 domain-containing protein [Oscillospiraceae bacterium]
MLYVVLGLWIFSALMILFEKKNVRVTLYLGIFGLLASIAFFLLGSPDVAMAEAAISTFTTIFFIVCLEKYYKFEGDFIEVEDTQAEKKPKSTFVIRYILPLLFTIFAAGLFIYFIPDNVVNPYLKELYLTRFMDEVGGYNPVTAIYLRYRVYDTLFEALMLVLAVVAVIHMSKFGEATIKDGLRSELETSNMSVFTIRLITPILLVFGIFLILNGHISAGGGFQGGLVIATFFIARYMIFNIYDLKVSRIAKIEEAVFIAIALLASVVVFLEFADFTHRPGYREIYLIIMNALIGAKVACGFMLLFYRFVAIERGARDES